MTSREIIAVLDNVYPPSLASSWDNPGLLAGRADKTVRGVYIALDATDKVIAEAIRVQADMLLTHHPLLMAPLKQINDGDFTGRRLISLIQADITCFAMHTNYDIVTMAPLAAEMLGLAQPRVLEVTGEADGRQEGFGRVGALPEVMTLRQCGEYVKETFGLDTVKIFGDLDQPVKRGAVSPGSGKSMVTAAVNSGADVLISGDFGHHDGIDAVMQGVAVIDAGHYGLEKIFIRQMKDFLGEHFPALRVYCEQEENPFQVI